MRSLALSLFVGLVACNGTPKESDSTTATVATDLDQDGFSVDQGDCNDNDASIFPGATEVQGDGIDQDCDPSDDLLDEDGDGYLTDVDCNDGDVDIHPDATEICDEVDNNCDGETDEGVQKLGYEDGDGDGVGSDAQVIAYCDTPPEGYVAEEGDCDKNDASTYPGAPELCDNKDNDCDGTVDNDAPADRTWYLDADLDNYGDPTQSIASCVGPTGYSMEGGDCNDADAGIHPGAAEDCDLVDRDCDGQPQNNPVDGTWYYPDLDGDSYGDNAAGQAYCEPPPELVLNGGDCDDTNPAIAPGKQEYCDGIDNNCDGTTDEAGSAGESIWYVDADGDGFGDVSQNVSACNAPVGYVEDANDCDDTDPALGGPQIYYVDADGDGFGEDTSAGGFCDVPTDRIQVGGDCDDADAAVNPNGIEVCDLVDNNCDNLIDDASAADVSTWYIDGDADGFGDPTFTEIACWQPESYSADSSDCNDLDARSYPGATEYCDGIDNNCDGTSDEDSAVNASTWYEDLDGDSYGANGSDVVTCYQPSGYVLVDGDCDDTQITVNPAATEVCDGVDNDCDGGVDESGALGESTWYVDGDGDGYGDASLPMDACDQPSGFVSDATDCEDNNSSMYPGNSEAADAADNDCDGCIDEDFVNVGDLVLSEVARQPRFGGTSVVSDGQWFEVYNAGSSTIYLDNWLIERTSGVGTDSFSVDPAAQLSVDPGNFLVFCNTDSYDLNNDPFSAVACDYVWSDSSQASGASGTYFDNTFNLQPDEDTLSFYVEGSASTGVLIDTVSWYSDTVNGVWPKTATYSMMLKTLTASANDSLSNWCLPKTTSLWYHNGTIKEYGTPGYTAACQ